MHVRLFVCLSVFFLIFCHNQYIEKYLAGFDEKSHMKAHLEFKTEQL